MGQKMLNHLVVPIPSCEVKRRVLIAVQRVNIGSALQQRQRRFVRARASGGMESRTAVLIFGRDVGTDGMNSTELPS